MIRDQAHVPHLYAPHSTREQIKLQLHVYIFMVVARMTSLERLCFPASPFHRLVPTPYHLLAPLPSTTPPPSFLLVLGRLGKVPVNTLQLSYPLLKHREPHYLGIKNPETHPPVPDIPLPISLLLEFGIWPPLVYRILVYVAPSRTTINFHFLLILFSLTRARQKLCR